MMTIKAALFPTRVPEPRPPSWFQRVCLGAVNPAGALASLNNLYLDGVAVTKEQRDAACRAYGVSTEDAQRAVFSRMCADALERVVKWDKSEIAEGRKAVAHLAASLGLTPLEYDEVQETMISLHLNSIIKSALGDRRVPPTVHEHVRTIGHSFGMNDAAIEAVIHAAVNPLVVESFESAIADRRYTPGEQRDLEKLASDLGVKLRLGVSESAKVERFRLLWEIENGRLPVIAVSIALHRKEVCHYSCDASWWEMRTRTVRVNYHGPTARIRIMKGVYWRFGSIAPQRVTESNLQEVAAGILYVTNRRVILDGASVNKSVTWRSVFGQEVFSDAIMLEKSSGKNPYLFLSGDDLEMASTVIAAAMAAAG